MTFRSKLHGPAIGMAMIALVAALSISAAAAGTYSAKAFSFVGTAAQCDPFPAGNRIITSSWLNGAVRTRRRCSANSCWRRRCGSWRSHGETTRPARRAKTRERTDGAKSSFGSGPQRPSEKVASAAGEAPSAEAGNFRGADRSTCI